MEAGLDSLSMVRLPIGGRGCVTARVAHSLVASMKVDQARRTRSNRLLLFGVLGIELREAIHGCGGQNPRNPW